MSRFFTSGIVGLLALAVACGNSAGAVSRGGHGIKPSHSSKPPARQAPNARGGHRPRVVAKTPPKTPHPGKTGLNGAGRPAPGASGPPKHSPGRETASQRPSPASSPARGHDRPASHAATSDRGARIKSPLRGSQAGKASVATAGTRGGLGLFDTGDLSAPSLGGGISDAGKGVIDQGSKAASDAGGAIAGAAKAAVDQGSKAGSAAGGAIATGTSEMLGGRIGSGSGTTFSDASRPSVPSLNGTGLGTSAKPTFSSVSRPSVPSFNGTLLGTGAKTLPTETSLRPTVPWGPGSGVPRPQYPPWMAPVPTSPFAWSRAGEPIVDLPGSIPKGLMYKPFPNASIANGMTWQDDLGDTHHVQWNFGKGRIRAPGQTNGGAYYEIGMRNVTVADLIIDYLIGPEVGEEASTTDNAVFDTIAEPFESVLGFVAEKAFEAPAKWLAKKALGQ